MENTEQGRNTKQRAKTDKATLCSDLIEKACQAFTAKLNVESAVLLQGCIVG